MTIDAIYDRDRHRFNRVIFPVGLFFALLIVFFFIGVLFDYSTMILFSYTMLIAGIIAIVHDHWITNSIVAPTSVMMIMFTAVDVLMGQWLSAIVHGITAVAGVIAALRRNTSLVIMVMSTVSCAAYIYSLNRWLGVYACGLPFCDPSIQFTAILCFGLLVSALVTAANYHYKKKGEGIDCDGGFCPW
jgi:hypothetical protein